MRVPFVARARLAIAIAALMAITVAPGCEGDAAPADDAATRRDAALQEGGVVPEDGGAIDAAASTDAGPADAGAPAACAAGDCDPRDVASCGGVDGGACVLRDRLPVCLAAAGTYAEGEACTTETDCAETLACFLEGSAGVCARVCCPGEIGVCGDATDAESYCRADGVLASGITTSWGRCSAVRPCDVLAPEVACASGEGCYVESERMRSVCRRAGTGEVGATCERQTDCAAGLFCGGIPTSTCVRICRLDEPGSCPDEEGRCVAQAYSPPGSGVCVVTAAAR
jgi:hypothetical protein